MTIDFTDAKKGVCLGCRKVRLLGVADGVKACLLCHCEGGEKQGPRVVHRFTFTPNRNIGQARHVVGRNGLDRRGRQGKL